jgi:hypothetical protein
VELKCTDFTRDIRHILSMGASQGGGEKIGENELWKLARSLLLPAVCKCTILIAKKDQIEL